MPLNLNLKTCLPEGLDVKATTKAVAVGRIALGASYLATPGLAMRLWPGRPGSTGEDRAVARLLARSVGGRDIALGVGALLALSHDAPVRGWVEAAMLADAGDALAIGIAFRRLPRARAVLMFAASLGTAALGRVLASSDG
jgi:hypothetical protein